LDGLLIKTGIAKTEINFRLIENGDALGEGIRTTVHGTNDQHHFHHPTGIVDVHRIGKGGTVPIAKIPAIGI